jgi:hypothetical protein
MVTAVRALSLLVLLLLAPARRVDVVGLLLPSHLTCDGLESWEGFPLPPAAECGIWHCFALYVDTVCWRCLDAGVDCGCDDGLGNPAVGEIMRYIERTVATVQHAAPNGFLPRVVVQVSGGLEIMEDPYLWFVNAGVRQFLADSFRGRHFFFLSHFIYLGASVLDSPVDIISQPSAQVWDESRTLGEALVAIRASGDPVICVHLRTGLPNVMMLHQVLPDSVRRSSKVVMVRDDGERRWLEVEKGYAADCCQGYLQVLREILACIQLQVEAARSHRGGPDAGDGARDTGGAGGEEKGGQQRVIVLWAADHDLVPKRIRSAFTSMHGVVVVSLDTSERASVRGDAALSTALQDMALLSAASHIVGAIQSTFTYLMYARALARPVLSLFRPGEGRQCMAHESSEGGFLLRGTFPTNCTWRPAVSFTDWPINSGKPLDFHCQARVSCVTTFQLWKNTGGKCLYPIPLTPESSGTQRGVRAASSGRDSGEADGSGAEYFVARPRYQLLMNFLMMNFSWATPLVSHTYDGAEYLLSHFSRYGWAVYLNDETLSLPVCPYAPRPQGPEKRWRRVTGGLGWAEASGGAGGGDDDLDDMACIYADRCTE